MKSIATQYRESINALKQAGKNRTVRNIEAKVTLEEKCDAAVEACKELGLKQVEVFVESAVALEDRTGPIKRNNGAQAASESAVSDQKQQQAKAFMNLGLSEAEARVAAGLEKTAELQEAVDQKKTAFDFMKAMSRR